ncbi:phage portal protein [Parapedobacter soli]|uniref:phage portal protein n=1 Tax=Parapedobacter soli TaxID=416955 RepID=UPI0021C731B7|nr:phage portal protein [Parapedobacter soli]
MKVTDFMPKGENTIDALIENLRKRERPLPDVELFKKQLNPMDHDVMDQNLRRDKDIIVEKYKKGANGKMDVYEEAAKEKVNRIALALQKLVVERAIAFLFGNDPKMSGDVNSDIEKLVFNIVSKIKKANKTRSTNRRVARALFSATEVAEYWFAVPAERYTKYGVSTSYKLRHKIYSPLAGYKLYPRKDETGDMVAFSLEYTRVEGNVSTTYFEAYTDEEKMVFTRDSLSANDWRFKERRPIPIGKIPFIYAEQPQVEWADVQILIERLEKLLSNFADTNDYHASPKIFIEGILKGFAKKGDAGAILQGEKGSKASYLSWDHAPESVRLEIETLLGQIFSLTQTPNISFDSVKGLGAISGIALKLLFLDAHLKVKNKEETFTEYLQRRNSIILSYAGLLHTPIQSTAHEMDLDDEIEPYMIEDLKEMVDTLLAANGNQPVISHEQSVRRSPLTDNPEDDYRKIQEETKARQTVDVFEETF